MARFFKIIKKPRETPLADIPISFPKLENLHLELLEIKDKLKKNLPPIPVSKPQINLRKDKPQEHEKKKEETPSKSIEKESKHTDKKPDKSSKHSKKDSKELTKKSKSNNKSTDKFVKEKTSQKSESSNKKSKKKKEESSDDELVKELGDKSDEDSKNNSDNDSDDDSDEESESEEDEDEESEEDKIETEEVDIYAGMTPEERLAAEKEEFIWKFRLLKKQFGKSASIPIPEYNEHSDLGMMKKSYERTIKELYLDDAVETYRTYLLGGWIVMEYVCTQFLEIDLEGFTLQQIKMMYKYDRMLIELGEKSYTRWGMNLPVEIRLLFMILFQAGIFYLGKVISDKLGNSTAELFRGMTGQPPTRDEPLKRERSKERPTETPSAPKPKMRGPRINAEDIRNQANKNKEKEDEEEDGN